MGIPVRSDQPGTLTNPEVGESKGNVLFLYSLWREPQSPSVVRLSHVHQNIDPSSRVREASIRTRIETRLFYLEERGTGNKYRDKMLEALREYPPKEIVTSYPRNHPRLRQLERILEELGYETN